MRRQLIAVGLTVSLGLLGACSQGDHGKTDDDVEQAWTDMKNAIGELETAEEKMPHIEAFLREHPNTGYAGRLAGAVAYYQGEAMGDPEGAFTLLNDTLAANTDVEARFKLGMALFPLSVELGRPTDLGAVAEELAATRELSFGERIDVADAAVEYGQWETGAAYAESALAKATPEAFLADYPDDDYTQAEAEAKASRRKAMSYADLGWALHNLGETERAMEAFERGAAHRSVDYLGVADTPIDLYYGQALLAAGETEKAIGLLTPGAIMGSDDKAMEALQRAHAALRMERSGFHEFVESERRRLARMIDDFTLADYEGEEHDFSALADGKVTLLAFWFPT